VSTAEQGDPGNVRRFIAFRILFNARWYYPVYALVFLDLGLGLGAFSLLNGLWALTIVLCEVPSGALADRFGRKRLLVAAAGLMVIEMALLAFAPAGGGPWLLLALGLNRLLSGMAEAAASGADEALAYDSLPAGERERHWSKTLTTLMRWQSVAMMLAMLCGAALYDPGFVNGLLGWFGMQTEIPAAVTHRIPAILTLGNAIVLFFVTLGFRETCSAETPAAGLSDAFRSIPQIGRWILGHRAVLLTIVGGMVLDSFVRLFLTLNSGYYRLIGLPEASFGLLAAAMGVMGFLIPPLAARLRETASRATAFGVAALVVLGGLLGVGLVRHPIGLVAALLLGAGMFLIGFFVSAYLNADTPSEKRATVLSFKGLAFNLGYGAVSAWFALLQWQIKQGESGRSEEWALAQCLPWVPLAALIGIGLVLILARWHRGEAKR